MAMFWSYGILCMVTITSSLVFCARQSSQGSRQTAGSSGSSSSSCYVTPTVMLGPYYVYNSPSRDIVCDSTVVPGDPLTVTGRLMAQGCGTTIADATLDVWQAGGNGSYSCFGKLPNWACRGQVKTDSNGKFKFYTVIPGWYDNRPHHIHVKVRATGYSELTTQLYFPNDPYANYGDHSSDSSNIIKMTSASTGVRDIVLSKKAQQTSANSGQENPLNSCRGYNISTTAGGGRGSSGQGPSQGFGGSMNQRPVEGSSSNFGGGRGSFGRGSGGRGNGGSWQSQSNSGSSSQWRNPFRNQAVLGDDGTIYN